MVHTEIKDNILFNTVDGDIILDQAEKMLLQINEGNVRDIELSLWDIRKSDVGQLLDNDIRRCFIDKMISLVKQSKRIKVAIVCSGDMMYGSARMISSILSKYVTFEIRVFKSMDEGIDYLKKEASK